MKKVYFISGLGADKRAFSFLDLSFCEPLFVDWIKPEKRESLQQYALRLRQTIPDKDPMVVGMSFGGMLASEMARAECGVKAIIISSNKNSKEFPSFLRIGKYLPLYNWVPFSLLKRSQNVYSRIFGAKGSEQKKVLRQIVADTDPQFVRWGIHSILHWKSEDKKANIIHIHGTADILLPFRLVKADYVIQSGKHVMTLDQHEEISPILKELIQ
ncbi:MAG: alpha/beta hydrolase [Chitinophagaceae bacterium]